MVNFVTEFGATITTSTNNKVTVCFNSRGYAWDCGVTSVTATGTVQVTFSHAQRTAAARVRPLGQMVRL
jgi:hypothetical protein